MQIPKERFILLGVTGSIAAYRAADLVSALKKRGRQVVVLLTEEAKAFVTPLTLQTLSGNPVFSDFFQVPQSQDRAIHIALAERAELIAVVPATANSIGKVANGICDDLLSCVIMAATAPVIWAPAMNTQMYQHPAMQANLQKLQSMGYSIIDPEEGVLACGTEGIGHIAELEKLVNAIEKELPVLS